MRIGRNRREENIATRVKAHVRAGTPVSGAIHRGAPALRTAVSIVAGIMAAAFLVMGSNIGVHMAFAAEWSTLTSNAQAAGKDIVIAMANTDSSISDADGNAAAWLVMSCTLDSSGNGGLVAEPAAELDETAHAYWHAETSGDYLTLSCASASGSAYLAYGNNAFTLTSSAGGASTFNLNSDGAGRIKIPSAGWPEVYFDSSAMTFKGGAWGNSGAVFTVLVDGADEPTPEPELPDHADTGDPDPDNAGSGKTYTEKTDTVSPSSTVINLFDYWDGAYRAALMPGWAGQGATTPVNQPASKINVDPATGNSRSLQFVRNSNGSNGLGLVNQYTNSEAVRQGIVKNTLTNGIPTIATGNTLPASSGYASAENESLAYLFDPTVTQDGKASFSNVQGLLSVSDDGYFYYNSQENYAYFNEDTNNFTLYQQSASAGSPYGGQFYPFNPIEKTDTYENPQDQRINHFFGLTLTTRFIQRSDGYADDLQNLDSVTTFEFSGDDDVWIFIDDVLVADLGGIHNAASVQIDFHTGLVSINGGGIAAQTDSSGQQTTEVQGTTISLRDAYRAAGHSAASDESYWSTNAHGETYANGTSHTLKFFYLERGAGESDMHLKYNLNNVPETSIYKVDQYGNKISGAAFATYKTTGNATENGLEYVFDDGSNGTWPAGATVDPETGVVTGADGTVLLTPTYVGVTDENGAMLFKDSYGQPLPSMELKQKLGTQFILREIDVPAGYRVVADEMLLYFEGDLLQAADPYGTGVWASPTILATATNTLYKVEDNMEHEAFDYYDVETATSNGTLFAVLLKRNGAALTNIHDMTEWTPIYGNDERGYAEIATKGVAGAIAAAQYQTGIQGGLAYADAVFSQSSEGMQLYLDALPGNAMNYYSFLETTYFHGSSSEVLDAINYTGTNADMLEKQRILNEDLEYLVAYYWTEADSLAGATTANTWRVHSHKDSIANVDSYDGFTAKYGSVVQVPNVENRLYFQNNIYYAPPTQTDGQDKNEFFTGETFAMYNVGETADGQLYYIADNGTAIVLDSDSNSNEVADGSAWLIDTATGERISEKGKYAISQSGGADSTLSLAQIGVTIPAADGIGVPTLYVISPATNANGESLVKQTVAASQNPVEEDGTNYFSRLLEGHYVMRQVTAPCVLISSPSSSSGDASSPTGDGSSSAGNVSSTGDGSSSSSSPLAGTGEAERSESRSEGWSASAASLIAPDGSNIVRDATGAPVSCSAAADYPDATQVQYLINQSESLVDVHSTAIYANAGGERNAVIVGNGAGFVVKTLDVFASQGAIDESLSWIASLLKVNYSQTFGTFEQNMADATWGTDSSGGTAAGISKSTTTDLADAMVTYLEYDPTGDDSIFDYKANQDQTARVLGTPSNSGSSGDITVYSTEGEGTKRLYTDEGWSALVLYQDYLYGIAHTTPNTDYKNLTNIPSVSTSTPSALADSSSPLAGTAENEQSEARSEGWSSDASDDSSDGSSDGASSTTTTTSSGDIVDLTALFSNSTFVRFYNSPTASLSLVKVENDTQVYENEDVPDEDKVVTGFSKTVTGATFLIYYEEPREGASDGETASITWYLTTDADAADSVSIGNGFYWTDNPDDAGEFISGSDGTIVTGVSFADGTYVAEEIDAPEGYAEMPSPVSFTVASGVFTAVSPNGMENDKLQTAISQDNMTLWLGNEPAYTLPATGARSTNLWIPAFIALLLAGALALYIAKMNPSATRTAPSVPASARR